MGSRIKKKAIPLIATTVLATTAFAAKHLSMMEIPTCYSKRTFKGGSKTK